MTNCDGVAGSTCVQRDNQHVDKKDCAFYAGNIGYRWGGNSNDGNVKGCFVQHGAKTVYFNEKNTDTKCEDVDGSTCIQKKNLNKRTKNTTLRKSRNALVFRCSLIFQKKEMKECTSFYFYYLYFYLGKYIV